MTESEPFFDDLSGLVGSNSLLSRGTIAQESLLLLAELANELTTATDFGALKQILTRKLRWIVDFDRCTLAVRFESQKAKYVLYEISNPSQSQSILPLRVSLDEGWPGKALLDSKPYFLQDLTQLPDLITPPPKPDLGLIAQVRSLMLLPLRVGDRTVGSLNFSTTTVGAYSLAWRNLTSLLAAQVSGQLASILTQTQLKSAYEFRRRVIESGTEAIYTLDLAGNFTFVNQRTTEITGYSVEELLGLPFIQLFSTKEGAKIRQSFLATVQQGVSIDLCDAELLRKDGHRRSIIFNLAPLLTAEKISAVVGCAQDITKRKQAEEVLLRVKIIEAAKQKLEKEIAERKRVEEALITAQARLKYLLTSNPTVIYSSKASEDYGITFISENVALLLGYEAWEFTDDSRFWVDRVHPEDICRVFAEFSGLSEQESQSCKYRFLHKDGTYRWIHDHLRLVQDTDGKLVELIGSWQDITEHKQAEEQLRYNAFYDGLTGLPNRALFMDRLAHALARAQRQADCLFAVLFLDLDRFKVINDSLGHMIGDQLLIAVAQRIEACVRVGDTVARLGGDEFVVLLEEIQDAEDALSIVRRILEELQLPFNLNGHEVFTSVTIGIAFSEAKYGHSEEILRDADIAMYHAKVLGKARYKIFNPDMHTRAVRRLLMETDLRHALERQELRVYYQPIVSLETGQIAGFESLLRWQHPQRGLVHPDEFIPIAEETGLITPMSWWVLQEVCHQMSLWQALFSDAFPLTVSVNLSGKLFMQASLIDQIKQTLQTTGLDVCRLRLEITESILVENTEAAAELLSQLQSLGVQVYLDDFGTGYSSLSYLHYFPINAIKIDRSFIETLGVDGRTVSESNPIVQSIILLARNLNMQVIAEGIETVEQLTQLKAFGYKDVYGQGYFFSRPLDSSAATDLLQTKPHW